jgi:phosphotransferase system HPr (HPr) family protein
MREIPMPRRTFRIRNELGLHLRSASLLVEEVGKYESKVFIYKNNVEDDGSINVVKADGSSILSVIGLFAAKDSEIIVEALGDDAEVALDGLEDLVVRRKFDEE